ncbi:MAG: T9SS type A sorting domain-containing protein, partial [Bacteroidota bacterium]
VGYSVKSTKATKVDHNSSSKMVIDTAGLNSTYTPQFAVGGTVGVIGMINSSNQPIGYWFGNSGYASADSTEADYWAQCWVSSGTVKIAGILFYAAGKSIITGGTTSAVQMGIQNMLPYVAGSHGAITGGVSGSYTFGPSPVTPYLASGTMNIANVDTSFLAFNYIPLPTMPTVAGDFCAVSNFKGIRVNQDTLYMFCDADGEGLGLDFSQYNQNPASYYWVSCKFSTIDRNMSVFAVIDDGAGINEEGFFQGMKMSIRNNPARENAFIDYYLQYSASVKLHVYDISGKEIMVIDAGSQASGLLQTINLNTCDLKAGNYFVSLDANGRRFTKKLVVE